MTRAIFLSASVPDPRRHEQYHSTADLTAIRDATRALVTVVLPHARLVWGGHPAITPLIRVIAQGIGVTGEDRVRIFQSNFHRRSMPKDNEAFEKVIKTRAVRGDQTQSMQRMRRQMLESEAFFAGVFIGGMDGVEEEYAMFCEMHPTALKLPVASTGAAALIIYRRDRQSFSKSLETDLAYPTLFRTLLDLP
jgi:hypothetical protein